MSSVLMLVLLADIGPIVVPQGISWRGTNSCIGTLCLYAKLSIKLTPARLINSC